MTLQQLKYLLTVAEYKNIIKAKISSSPRESENEILIFQKQTAGNTAFKKRKNTV